MSSGSYDLNSRNHIDGMHAARQVSAGVGVGHSHSPGRNRRVPTAILILRNIHQNAAGEESRCSYQIYQLQNYFILSEHTENIWE